MNLDRRSSFPIIVLNVEAKRSARKVKLMFAALEV